MTTVTTRINDDTQARQTSLPRPQRVPAPGLVADAVRRYAEEEGWQIAAIEEGVREADAGNFATEEEVKAAFAKWGVDVR